MPFNEIHKSPVLILSLIGEWCHLETNECLTATCSPIHDCVDLVGSYRCDYNPGLMAAIVLICTLCLVAVFVLAGFRVWKRKKTDDSIDSRGEEMPLTR